MKLFLLVAIWAFCFLWVFRWFFFFFCFMLCLCVCLRCVCLVLDNGWWASFFFLSFTSTSTKFRFACFQLLCHLLCHIFLPFYVPTFFLSLNKLFQAMSGCVDGVTCNERQPRRQQTSDRTFFSSSSCGSSTTK